MATKQARDRQRKEDLSIEYHTESVDFSKGLRVKVESRLQKLAGGHRDIAGASVAVQIVNGAARHSEYKARLVLYHKPANIAAIRKADTVSNAVLESVDAVERQVRQQRERARERSRVRRS